jgi:ABC-2 type transport system ATP-binding protein
MSSPRADGTSGIDEIVRIEGLVKQFGRFRALDGLDLDVRRGEVHGFLGPNGAGKSTTIRILLGLMRCDGGRIELFGRDPWREGTQVRGDLAYVPGDVSLWSGLTGGQCMDILAGVHGRLNQTRRTELVERFDLDPTKRARDYSKGNRQKVALVAALASDVEMIVLDEPTSGLDPLMEQVFQEVIRERRAEGATVLLSSHILSEVEALADRVSIVRRGRTVTSGSLAELRRHTRTTVHAVTARRVESLETVRGVGEPSTGTVDGQVETRFSVGPDGLDEAIGRVHQAGIRSLTVEPPSLDALFLSRYRDDQAPPQDVPAPEGSPA